MGFPVPQIVEEVAVVERIVEEIIALAGLIPQERFQQQQKVDFLVPEVLEEILEITDVSQERIFQRIGEQTVEQIVGEDIVEVVQSFLPERLQHCIVGQIVDILVPHDVEHIGKQIEGVTVPQILENHWGDSAGTMPQIIEKSH